METLFDVDRSALDSINDPLLEMHNVQLWIKRDDEIDPEVSGNKWRKLKYNILQCRQQKNQGILTFGGAFSNHLVATAAACSKAGLNSVGVVRGDELKPTSNSTLKRCASLGMHLHFVSREEYYLRNERYYHEELLQQFPNLLVVPEGGANYRGMIGCQELVGEISVPFHRLFVAQGTSTTSCGVLFGLSTDQVVSVVPVLKGFDSIAEMQQLLSKSGIDSEIIASLLSRVEVLDWFHFGGYAKYTDVLLRFISEFYQVHGVKLDPVYTGKAMFALWDGIKKGKYDGQSIVFLHTGGLQGIAGIESKTGASLFGSKE